MGRREDLDALDDVLTGVRRLLQRPGYRRHFLAGLGVSVSPGVLRAVRMVSRLDSAEPSMGDVAGGLAVDASTASRLVDSAVDAGYLSRRQSAEDGRRLALDVTAEGRAMLRKADTVRRDLLGEVTCEWTTDEVHALVVLLDRLLTGLDRFDRT